MKVLIQKLMKQPTIYKSWEDYKVIDVTEDDVKKYGSELDAALIITGIGYKSEAVQRKYRVVLQNGLYYNYQNGYWMNAGIRDYDDTTIGMKEYHFWYKEEETNDSDANSKEQENNDDNQDEIKENKTKLHTMLNNNYETLLDTLKVMYKEAFRNGPGVRMQIFVDDLTGELFTTANPSEISVCDCTCIYNMDSYVCSDVLSDEIDMIIKEKYTDFKGLDWSEINKKLSFEERIELEEEAIYNLTEECFDYNHEATEILSSLIT